MAEERSLSAPVILLGRGGSGTRLLSQLAAANGVFLGNALNESWDSLEWVDLVYELGIECTTAGVIAGSERDAYWRERLRAHAGTVLAAAARDPGAPWGWKLPETMLAIGPVLRAFPGARAVHLVRHPVTSSLRRTHHTSRAGNSVGGAVLPAAYRAAGLNPSGIDRDEAYVHNAVTWDFQVRGVLDALAGTSPAPSSLQLRYEEVCADPRAAQELVALFFGAPAPDDAPPPVIDPSRTSAIAATHAQLERIWSICSATAARLGYAREV